MCNAHNHPPGCQCGWGGTGHRGRRSGYSYNYTYTAAPTVPSFYAQLDDQWKSRNHNQWPPGHALTIPIVCWFCQSSVYLHTNGNGDSVLLEPPLGAPWRKHNCQDLKKVRNYHVANKASWDLQKFQIQRRDTFAALVTAEVNPDHAAVPSLQTHGFCTGVLLEKESKKFLLLHGEEKLQFWPVFDMDSFVNGSLLRIEFVTIARFRVALSATQLVWRRLSWRAVILGFGRAEFSELQRVELKPISYARSLTKLEAKIVRAMSEAGYEASEICSRIYDYKDQVHLELLEEALNVV